MAWWGQSRKKLVKDPVCGLEMHRRTAAGERSLGAVTYYFCCTICTARFDREPGRFAVASLGSSHPTDLSGAHPEPDRPLTTRAEVVPLLIGSPGEGRTRRREALPPFGAKGWV